jgi:hypothetical protein
MGQEGVSTFLLRQLTNLPTALNRTPIATQIAMLPTVKQIKPNRSQALTRINMVVSERKQ